MGAVKLETKSQGRNNHQWDNVSLNSIDVINVLIRYRSKFEESYLSKELYTTNVFETNGLPEFVEVITCLYVDLDNYIKEADLYKIELFIIKKFMLGYNLEDVQEIINKKLGKKYRRCNIQNVYMNAVKKILKEYEYKYQEWLELTEKIKIQDKKKFHICVKCGKSFERTFRNFDIKRSNADKMDNRCKNCHKKMSYK